MKCQNNSVLVFIALVGFALMTGNGCVASDPGGGSPSVRPLNENTSSRPWNEPRGFDAGTGRDPRRGF